MSNLSLNNIEELLFFLMADDDVMFHCNSSLTVYEMRSRHMSVVFKPLLENINHYNFEISLLDNHHVVSQKSLLVMSQQIENFLQAFYEKLNLSLNDVYIKSYDLETLVLNQDRVLDLLAEKVNEGTIKTHQDKTSVEVRWEVNSPNYFIYHASLNKCLLEHLPPKGAILLNCFKLTYRNGQSPYDWNSIGEKQCFSLLIPNKNLEQYPRLNIKLPIYENEETKLHSLIEEALNCSPLARKIHLENTLPIAKAREDAKVKI